MSSITISSDINFEKVDPETLFKEKVRDRLFDLVDRFNPAKKEVDLESGEFSITLTSALKGKISKKLGEEGIKEAAGATLAIKQVIKGKLDFTNQQAFFDKDIIVLDVSVVIPNISLTRVQLNKSNYEFEGSCLFGSGSMSYTKAAIECTLTGWDKKEVKSKNLSQ
ncbi:MAG: hypothetical protein JSS30_04685 [Verrucomicrobia bacterium]|nr:hypothetical protein [Verrucomicrobiota bacterium]